MNPGLLSRKVSYTNSEDLRLEVSGPACCAKAAQLCSLENTSVGRMYIKNGYNIFVEARP